MCFSSKTIEHMPTHTDILAISAVIATKDRPEFLASTLAALAKSTSLPQEIIIIDASEANETENVIKRAEGFEDIALRWTKATEPGAAKQRNQGVILAEEPYILFMDDDIIPEWDCLQRLHRALTENPALGGVSSMITNQQYQRPGRLSRMIVHTLGGTGTHQDAGKLLSGVRNVLPASNSNLPEIQPVEWLNTTCTLYRRKALPSPAFPPHFHGASVCEDLALSLVIVQRGWKLANARLARIFHDSQGGEHKAHLGKLIEEEFTNRAYVLRRILGKTSKKDLSLLLLSKALKRSQAAWQRDHPACYFSKSAAFSTAFLTPDFSCFLVIIHHNVIHDR